MKDLTVVKRIIVKDNPVKDQKINTTIEKKPTGSFRADNFATFNFPNLIMIFIFAFVMTFILKISLSYLIGSIIFLLPYQHKCSKCGKIFKYENQDKCPFCQKPLNDEIKGH